MLKMNLQLFAATTPVEFPLANIARVEIITEEEEPKEYRLIDVASEAEVIAYLSQGEEKPLRVKNVIKAQNKTEDIVMGYDIKLISATMIPEILALIDGGTWNPATKKYIAPVIGSPVKRTPFTLNIYTEEKDGDASTVSYVKFVYKNCKGKPVNYSLKDGEFFVPELPATSRPKLGASPVEFEILDELPA
ncbi:hypothetical protein NE686_00560 [Tissierella carlieri]|uniref:Uncharacterized protein n=1 Tax=Tissierella carlieri TaxID=689904 RepID=A0ABT1S518_9FIRM|nr:hypothetical protein [Tissierella carlieri]MCQ4921560.1 hypothetical protein [Tissierella carlieri]